MTIQFLYFFLIFLCLSLNWKCYWRFFIKIYQVIICNKIIFLIFWFYYYWILRMFWRFFIKFKCFLLMKLFIKIFLIELILNWFYFRFKTCFNWRNFLFYFWFNWRYFWFKTCFNGSNFLFYWRYFWFYWI